MEREYSFEDDQINNTENQPEVEAAAPEAEATLEAAAPEAEAAASEVLQYSETGEGAAGSVTGENAGSVTGENAGGPGNYNYGNYSYDYSSAYGNNSSYGEPQKPKKKKSGNGKKWVLCVSMAVIFGLVATATFQVSNRVVNGILGDTGKTNTTVGTTQTTVSTGTKTESSVAEVAANVMPSVVSITNLSVQEVQTFFFGGTQTQQTESSGSGIIVGQNDSELLIVTNNHVVEGYSTLTVSFHDGASVEAQLKGTNSDIDIAVIAVELSNMEESTLNAIKIATLGDSDQLAVGEQAIAIGNALGYGQSVTSGIISALDRELDGFETKLIQTDAAINPGNSGGALLNANGEVIGINTAKVNADAVEGMGYAIPISDVKDVINDLMNRQTRTKVNESEQGTIGIKGVSVSAEYSRIYGIPQGVQISEIIEGGAADKANLPKRGIITKFDGTTIESMDDLQGQLEYYKAGETVEIVVEVFNNQTGEYEANTYEITLSQQSILN